ncbi:MAG: D-glycero-alpha-D-manno-heptose-1,7-bisphosphate 7-phosphatase [Marinifilaceae bacterium]
MHKAIFLDRDGVINSDEGHYYIYRVEDFKINEGIIPSMKKFQEAGYLLFVVTNQGGVAKGIYSEEDVEKVHDYFQAQLKKEGVSLTRIYYCPHHESVAPCKCRKPSSYFLEQAIENFDIDPHQSYMIGDSQRDIAAAEGAGVKGIRIAANENINIYCDQIIQGKI